MTRQPTWRYLIGMGRSTPRWWAAHVLVWAVINLSGLVPGLVARAFFDALLGRQRWGMGVSGIIALIVGVGLGRAALFLLGGHVEINMRFRTSGLVRRNLLGHLLRRPGAAPLPYSAGETISRFRDDAHEAEDTLDWLTDAIGSTLFTIVALVILLRISVRVTLVMVGPVLLIMLLTRQLQHMLERYRTASSAATSQVTGALGDLLAAAQTLQAAGAEERALTVFRRLNEQRRKTMLVDRLLTQVLAAVTTNTVSIGVGLIMLLAAGSLRSGSMTVGDFVLFVSYLGFLADYPRLMGGFVADYQQTRVAVDRLAGVMDGEPGSLAANTPLYLHGPLPVVPPLPAAEDRLAIIDTRGLTYRYPESGRGIEGVDLRLRRGELTVVTGRVGAGKTTLLQALLGLLPLEAGEIRWNGRPVRDPACFLVPPRAAYTPQVPHLFSQTLAENILLGLPAAPAAVAAAIHDAVLERDVATLEAGLRTEVGTRGVKLSGGQIQRTAAARMLVRGAELLVIDDLSSALDVETERLLWERLFARRELTCLAVSHRRLALRRADHIVVLKDGRVEAAGSLDELLGGCAELRAIWDEPEEPEDLA